MALVMGDVDWFKAYNDRNGQEAGNRLLRELGHVLKLAIREEDLICRYGGEEFLFFLMGVKDVEEAALLTERIRKNVEDHYFELQEFQPRGNLTMSFGVTVFPKSLGERARRPDQGRAQAPGRRGRPGPGRGQGQGAARTSRPAAPRLPGRQEPRLQLRLAGDSARPASPASAAPRRPRLPREAEVRAL